MKINMKLDALLAEIALGEDSSRQFKTDVRNSDSLASEILLTVPKGLDKPYFDRKGVIWLKCGADKQRVKSKEELRRLFQFSDQFHADKLPTRAGLDKLDKLRFRDFLRDVYQQDFPDAPDKLMILLQNLNLATDEGMLNLAGVLLFAERPEWIKPQFVIRRSDIPAMKSTPAIM